MVCYGYATYKHTKISCEEIDDDDFFTAIFIVVERSRSSSLVDL